MTRDECLQKIKDIVYYKGVDKYVQCQIKGYSDKYIFVRIEEEINLKKVNPRQLITIKEFKKIKRNSEVNNKIKIKMKDD